MRAHQFGALERSTKAKRRLLMTIVAGAATLGLVVGPLNGAAAVGGPSGATAQAAAASPIPEFANPERGYMKLFDNCGEQTFTAARLKAFREKSNLTLVHCVFYLWDYLDTEDLSLQRGLTDPTTGNAVSALELVTNHMKAALAAGVKIVWRFAYTREDTAIDAPQKTVEAHIAKLAPIFNQYRGVVHVFQQGFIGQYGEGAYSKYFNKGTIDGEKDWKARNAVLRTLLQKLPKSMFIQVRTPLMKLMYLAGDEAKEDDYPKANDPATAPLTSAEAYTGTDKARIGHVNDCFLKNPHDAGTYRTKVIKATATTPERPLLKLDKEYVEAESRFLPVGGETCGFQPSTGPDKPTYERRPYCGTGTEYDDPLKKGDDNQPLALSELARFHWNYLNVDKDDTVNGVWKENVDGGPCWQPVADRLGYRFEVASKNLSIQQTATSRTLSVTVKVANRGWGTPVSHYPVTVQLSKAPAYGKPFVPARTVTVKADPRRWGPGTALTFNVKINVTTLAAGKWDVSVVLPDRVLGNKVGYGIRLKNAVWRDLDPSSTVHTFANVLTTYTAP